MDEAMMSGNVKADFNVCREELNSVNWGHLNSWDSFKEMLIILEK
jgi:hypothetical protein